MEATNQSNKAFKAILKSIESVGKSFGDGLTLLANAVFRTYSHKCSMYRPQAIIEWEYPPSFTAFPDNFQRAQNNNQKFENTEPQ